MAMRVLVADGVAREGVDLLKREVEVDVSRPLTEDQLMACIDRYDGVIVRSATRVTAKCIARAARLKVIGRAGAGVDNIDVDAATRNGIVVVNAPGGNSVAVAEHTIGLLLCLARYIPQAHAALKAGVWEKSKFLGVEVRGKTLGLLGLGRIGTEVAKRALALGMTVMAYDPAVSPDRVLGLGATPAEPDEIFSRADFISVHVPVTPETTGMIGEAAIARMKPTARIINCARGKVVDEQALVKALAEKRIAGAALDVFWSEPLPAGHPLFSLDNVILTPHLAASTAEAQVTVAIETAKAVLAVLRGEIAPASVNAPAISPEDMRKLAPFLPLAELLGSFVVQWAQGMIRNLKVAWAGGLAAMDTRPLLGAVLKGVLRPLLSEYVNTVNAPLLARERGISVSELKMDDAQGLPSMVAVTARTSQGERSIAGTLGTQNEPRLVSIDGYRIDVAPTAHMLVCPHINQPGIIGQVGTILGRRAVNISCMNVAKQEPDRETIMVLGTDSVVPPDALDEIARVRGVLGVRPVYLE